MKQILANLYLEGLEKKYLTWTGMFNYTGTPELWKNAFFEAEDESMPEDASEWERTETDEWEWAKNKYMRGKLNEAKRR